ncbi:MAG: (Fe-S)-binding protein [Candidatus Marinimicrobia bacterium]|jgi:Fe-S oxidoreductase|nr:(Fe-S)-binding protein [Candidatus Neomarinimicrobiota bacterium]MBT3675696.1 (Fe-S)-binding protein [Candidatus Neomarinimicrobiota bacterium]MBT3763736.1 (Fe-S)-binding protein [Candidatus Neomarinimicrobiota bacterium]MBT4068364.1 (Fe-S)-binding protein [Candidatus Neomarinimicrobiota bacterium]MBT4271053.1 (Fe-S)-binding protein [Candidatus Neomarinimicrobiota bacterium]
MLSNLERILFVILVTVSMGLAWVTFRRMFKVIGRGSNPIDWAKALANWPKGLSVFLSQKTLFKTRPIIGAIHAGVAWGFTLYLLVNVIDVLYGMVPGFHFFPNNIIGDIYRFFVDIFSMIVIIGVVMFVVRRFITKDERLVTNEPVLLSESARKGIKRDSFIVGVFIILHVGFRFVGASFEVAIEGADWSQPGATLLASAWGGLSPESLVFGEHLGWWMALGLILGFMPYFPYSKHAHLFMGPLNYMAQVDRKSPSTLELMDLEDEDAEQFGAAKIEHLPQKQLLDGYACIMCNRCQDGCPAYQTGKELSPSALEINKRYYFNENVKEFSEGAESIDSLSKWMLSEEAAWSCTTCGFCIEVCPVGNEPMVDILRMRQDLVLMESNFPRDAMEVFDKIENYGNPWGMSPQDREKWTEGMEVPKMRDKGSAEYLYWAGCSGAYDDRGKDISKSVAKIMNKAGVDYAILGNEETCTGDSARRIGNEYLFQMQATQNMENFEKYGVKKIVTQCPHCLTTLKNDYGEMGAELEVIHHSEFIADLIKEGKISPDNSLEEDVTFHDACYVGRHHGEYDAPRDVLNSVMGDNAKIVEMPRNKEQSFCCGAGGGNMWYEIDKGKRINVERFEEAIETGAKKVATSCNFCMIMMEDARKVTGQDETMVVFDIAELVADRI